MSAKLPWYQWYHRDWLLSEARATMNLAERGLFRCCLDLNYSEGSIPADLNVLCRLINVDREEFDKSWPTVSKYFSPVEWDSLRMSNNRADEVMNENEQYRNAQSEHAKKGWAKRRKQRSSDPMGTHRLPKGKDPMGAQRYSDADAYADTESDKSIGFPIGKPPPNGSPKAPAWGLQFDAWWAIWPRKVGKEDALKAYGQNIGDIGERHRTLMANTALWEQREFGVRESSTVPYPAHFLRRGDWKDPPPEAKPSSVVSVADRLQRIAKQ